jgi:serine/arginine repetitive matrix protein 2
MPNGRGSSLGPSTTSTPPRRSGQRTSNQSLVSEQGLQRPESRGSVNYSLPTAMRAESPLEQRELTYPSPHRSAQHMITSPTSQNLVYDANTRSFLPYAEILAIEQRIRDAAQQPVKKKKRVSQRQFTGSHLAEGTMGRPHGTAVDATKTANHSMKPVELPAAAIATKAVSQPERDTKSVSLAPASVSPKKKKVVNVSDSESDQGSYMPNSSDNDSDFRSYNTRTGAMLAKKPSIVREDREREEREDDTPPKKSVYSSPNSEVGTRTFSPSPLPRSKAGRGKAPAPASTPKPQETPPVAPTPEPETTVVEDIKEPVTEPKSQGGRVQSISPARIAHFASSPDNLVVKHQPPARSISPRKSALKNLSLERNSSPAGEFGSRNGSVVGSDESPVTRKKAVRVSFDETNVVVGEAAGTSPADSPIVMSPQAAKRNWFSLSGRAKKKEATLQDEDDDEVMKPRPALPSFGSVRGRHIREPVEERQLVKPTEYSTPAEPATSGPAPPLNTSATGDIMEHNIGQSNDHLVGAVLSLDAASKNEANTSKSREPLPPQVTSVEGSGYHSDTDSTISVPGDVHMDVTNQSISVTSASASNENDMSEVPVSPPQTNDNIPQLSITQPTPILEMSEWLSMPGGFPESSSDSGSIKEPSVNTPTAEHGVSDLPPTIGGIAEPFNGPRSGSPVLGDVRTALNKSAMQYSMSDDTDDSDTTSIYSDAAEDLSDLEDGDGFQSLNAVVESSVTGPTVTPSKAPPESQIATVAKVQKNPLSKEPAEPNLDRSWGEAQEYWSGLSAEKKRQLEKEALDEEVESESTIEAKPPPKPKMKKKTTVAAPPVNFVERPQPYKHERTYMIQPGTKLGKNGYTPTMRSSPRVEPVLASDTQIRKSMRGQGSMHDSLRGAEKVEPRARQRPASLQASGIKSDPAAVKMHIRALSAATASAAARKDPAPTPTLRRRGSGDSDSSFKRARPAEVTTFRRTMRNSADQPGGNRQESPIGSSRFSLRSMSPSGSTGGRRPFNTSPISVPQTQLRNSLRNPSAVPSLRNKQERTKSPIRIPGFGRSQPSKPAKHPVSMRSSRFDDSSDEESRPAFQSRFVDSSDEDEELPPPPKQNGMRGSMRANQPVRSIPRPTDIDEGDSSDLPDSDDEKSPISPGVKLSKTRPNGTSNLGNSSIRRSGSGRGAMSPVTTITSDSTRPGQSRRGSFMSSILRRKKADPSSKVRKSDAESPARRDTPLERSKSDLMAVKRQESYNSTNGLTSSPKLQKRTNSSSWPLSPAPFDDEKQEDNRPFSADAADGIVGGETSRPNLGTRRSTATGLGLVDVNGPVGTTPARKKKKFQALRKMFKLDD